MALTPEIRRIAGTRSVISILGHRNLASFAYFKKPVVHDTCGFGRRDVKDPCGLRSHISQAWGPLHKPRWNSPILTTLSVANSFVIRTPLQISERASKAVRMEVTLKRIVLVTLLAHAALVPMLAAADELGYFNLLQPEWLQDYCVADRTSHIWVDGHVKCKNATHVHVSDFTYHGFNTPGDTNNPNGVAVTPVLVAQLASLNGQSLGLARQDFAKGGVVVPHIHPRASELLIVTDGSLYAGFVNSTNHLFATTLAAGDLFLFPKGLIHFAMNVGSTPAVAIGVFSSQNPGVQQVGRAMFGSSPLIDDAVLMKAFKISQHNVKFCEKNFNTTA